MPSPIYTDLYRRKAEEMRSQAIRAETPALRELYEDIAEEWTHMAETRGPVVASEGEHRTH